MAAGNRPTRPPPINRPGCARSIGEPARRSGVQFYAGTVKDYPEAGSRTFDLFNGAGDVYAVSPTCRLSAGGQVARWSSRSPRASIGKGRVGPGGAHPQKGSQ